MAQFIEIKWDIPSMHKVIANIRTKKIETESVAKDALTEVAQAIMQESKQFETPIDTGALMSTAHIYEPVTDGNKVRVRMGYAGPKDVMNPRTKKMVSTYALPVHENPPSVQKHLYGKWKYLEDPVRRYTDKMLSFLQGRLSVVFSKGVR
jgi:hypothetical protein